jgi:predicted secreted protein
MIIEAFPKLQFLGKLPWLNFNEGFLFKTYSIIPIIMERGGLMLGRFIWERFYMGVILMKMIPMFKKKHFCVILLVAMCAAGLWAGDTATFVDLGFSPDGKTYAFGQYGIQVRTLRPWADLYLVDVPKNEFVSGGRISYSHDIPATAGQDGSGALYRLISRNAALTDRYGINFLLRGQVLYIAVDGKEPDDTGESIEFRDFEHGASYKASLVPETAGSGASLTSSFYINLERTARDGSKKNYTVGNARIKRPLIASYHIRKVIVPPGNGSIVFVIETRKQGDNGRDIRYMVEAHRL